jgi:predicted kinase
MNRAASPSRYRGSNSESPVTNCLQATPPAVDHDHVRDLARRLATDHAGAPRSSTGSTSGMPDELRQRWTENLDGLRALAPTTVDSHVLAGIAHLALNYVYGRHPLLVSRVEAGKIRAVGDAAAVDGLEDAAGMAMDLERSGHGEAADSFLGWYAEFSGEARVNSLIHHYIAYRAIVRLRSTCRQASPAQGGDVSTARLLAGIALRHLRVAEPRLILVGGTPGTGKSTLAEALADRLGAVLLRSDRIHLAPPACEPQPVRTQPWQAGWHSHGAVHDTYDELVAVAATLLGYGESVVLDAGWSTRGERGQARDAAADAFSAAVELRCEAPAEVVDARLGGRRRCDAPPEIARLMEREFQPWPEAVPLLTTATVDQTVDRAVASILGLPS